MSLTQPTASRITAVLAASLILFMASCGPSPETQQRIADLEEAAAQKDDLLMEIADLGRFISDVNAELSDVSLAESGLEVMVESPIQASRESVLVKIQYLNGRIDESERKLVQSQRRFRSLSLESDTLKSLLAETITSYERTLENQRATIEVLNERVELLEAQNVQLAASVDTLSTQIVTLKSETNTVYYAVGTKDELLELGIVEKEGGARFLFIFGKRGETLVPSRELDPAAFTAINKDQITRITLPDSSSEYVIASRHPTDLLTADVLQEGKIRGSFIEIESPDQFWKNSKFLIVVRKS
jgi:cell division protein FtsB